MRCTAQLPNCSILLSLCSPDYHNNNNVHGTASIVKCSQRQPSCFSAVQDKAKMTQKYAKVSQGKRKDSNLSTVKIGSGRGLYLEARDFMLMIMNVENICCDCATSWYTPMQMPSWCLRISSLPGKFEPVWPMCECWSPLQVSKTPALVADSGTSESAVVTGVHFVNEHSLDTKKKNSMQNFKESSNYTPLIILAFQSPRTSFTPILAWNRLHLWCSCLLAWAEATWRNACYAIDQLRTSTIHQFFKKLMYMYSYSLESDHQDRL